MLQLVTSIFAFLHPFFVSVTEIKHNEKTKSLEISSKLFFDDFEHALEANYKQKLDILNPSEKRRLDPLIADYLGKHLVLQVNGKPVTLKYLGYEIEQEAVWCYMEVVKLPKVHSINITNDILFKEHESQVNLVHVSVGGQRKSTKLDNPAGLASFKF